MILLAMYTSNSRFERIKKRLDRIDGRLDRHDLTDASHRDALEIMRQMTALHERVAVVETKQASRRRSCLLPPGRGVPQV